MPKGICFFSVAPTAQTSPELKTEKSYLKLKIPLFTTLWFVSDLLRTSLLMFRSSKLELATLPTAEILSGKNARAWVSMVLSY